MKNSVKAALCLAASAALSTPAMAYRNTPHYTSVTVFGDSLVDAGNVSLLTAGATPKASLGYFQGRFTNGYDYTDLLSQALYGTPTKASLAGGTNFAFGGARATNTAAVPDLQEQLGLFNTYLAQPGHAIDPNGLYILNFGGNDVFAAASGNLPPGYANASAYLAAAAATYANGVQALNDLGARNILITGFPVLTSAFSFEAQGYLNADLNALSLNARTTLLRFDYLDFFSRVTTDPAAFGLPPLDLVSTCIGAGAQPNCTGIFSFDGTHPTAAIQGALFRDLDRQFGLTAAIPEPASWLLMIGGFALAGAAIRRQPRRPAAI